MGPSDIVENLIRLTFPDPGNRRGQSGNAKQPILSPSPKCDQRQKLTIFMFANFG